MWSLMLHRIRPYTCHCTARGACSTNTVYTNAHVHAAVHALAERRFSLVESVCSRQAGPLQQSSGVRGAICQWKTISGERSVPLVLMSTAGSFCSQRRHAKAIKGREQSSAESHSRRSGGTHTHTLHAHLYSFSLLFDASSVLDTHS